MEYDSLLWTGTFREAFTFVMEQILQIIHSINHQHRIE